MKIRRAWARPDELECLPVDLASHGTLFCLVTALRKGRRYVAEDPGLYRSKDGGTTWSWINQSRRCSGRRTMTWILGTAGSIYLGVADAEMRKEACTRRRMGAILGRGSHGRAKTASARQSIHGTRTGSTCASPRRTDPGLWLSEDAGETWWRSTEYRSATQCITFDPRPMPPSFTSPRSGSVSAQGQRSRSRRIELWPCDFDACGLLCGG